MSTDAEVVALRQESLTLVVQAEVLLGRLEAHQHSLETFLQERKNSEDQSG